MADVEKCARCGQVAESHDFDRESTFWGFFTQEVSVSTTKRLHLMATYFRRNPKYGSPVLSVDERKALCDPCWGLFVGRFLQGRNVAAMPGKEKF